jgi:hypothetical protein
MQLQSEDKVHLSLQGLLYILHQDHILHFTPCAGRASEKRSCLMTLCEDHINSWRSVDLGKMWKLFFLRIIAIYLKLVLFHYNHSHINLLSDLYKYDTDRSIRQVQRGKP